MKNRTRLKLVDTSTGLPKRPQVGIGFAYHPGESNRCPGCHRRQWLVGRITAECCHCNTALPIVAGQP